MIFDAEIAYWSGQRVHSQAARADEELFGLLALLERATAILREADLLRPERLTFDLWYDPTHDRGGAAAAATVPVASGFAAALQPLLDGAYRGLVPAEVTVHGPGRVAGLDGGTLVIDDIVTLGGRRWTGEYRLTIGTNCDAWLPRDLLGGPQPERHALNAPRLERALRRIDEELEVGLHPGDTKYAIAEGFRVRNVTYDSGEVFAPDVNERTEGEICTLLLLDGMVTIGPRLRAGSGDEVRLGFFTADPDARVLITFTFEHADGHDELERRLALDVPGVAALRYIGAGPAIGLPYDDVLIERLPAGRPACQHMPLTDDQVVAVGAASADVVAAAHAAGQVVSGICPELIYLDPSGRFAALVPRGPAFIASAPQRGRGLRSYTLPYEGYEALVLGRPGGPSGDVFALCASLQHLASGRHPFGRELPEIMERVMSGRPEPYPGSPRIGEILARGLGREAGRPSAAELASALRAARP